MIKNPIWNAQCRRGCLLRQEHKPTLTQQTSFERKLRRKILQSHIETPFKPRFAFTLVSVANRDSRLSGL